jgi:alpha-methylacyl-CoA racemase
MKLLEGIKVVSLAVNLPGPAAARRLCQLGAQVTKVEPPTGDPMAYFNLAWYEQLNGGQEVVVLDLKSSEDLESLDKIFEGADLLITASRPAALERLGLDWQSLHKKFAHLCQVAIVGYPPPEENEAGHDLTYQAKVGLLTPPQMPRTLMADMVGAEKTVTEALALLIARDRGQGPGYRMVALSDAARYMAEPWEFGITQPESILGGALPEYNLYEARGGWVAVAALEPHFKKTLLENLACDSGDIAELKSLFKTKTAREWHEWAKERDIPLAAVQ